MYKRRKTAVLLLLLTIVASHSKLLYGADGSSAGNSSGSQVTVSRNVSEVKQLPAQPSVEAAAIKGVQAKKDWAIRIGAGAILSPAFAGSSDYQLIVVPALKATYRNTFFASVEDGVGYAVINQYGWRAGPIAKIAFGRKEDGDNLFRVTGRKTSALRGLGNVDTTLEAGGFAEYRWNSMNAKIGLRKGLNGHEGLVGDLSVNYTRTSQSLSPTAGSPLVVSIGPRLTVVDATYNKAFFGVDADQAANSGLPRYIPGGGVLSYGVGSALVVPISRPLSAIFLAGYDRLTGDAGSSPLVRERGSHNQGMIGVLLNYEFGCDNH